jgi:hypothetical protein
MSGFGTPEEGSQDHMANKTVGAVMTKMVVQLPAETPLVEAAKAMKSGTDRRRPGYGWQPSRRPSVISLRRWIRTPHLAR